MSVFCEFHKAWRARFPGHELPAAWEEDVRANLAKHRSRVALLKEELEKEQFYVEYLERLLDDVHRHKDGTGDAKNIEELNEQEERGQCEGSEEVLTDSFQGLSDASLVTQAIDSAVLQKSQDRTIIGAVQRPTESPPSPPTEDTSPGGSSVKDLARRFSPSSGGSNVTGRPPAFNRSTSVPAPINSSPRHNTSGGLLNDESHFITVISVNGTAEEQAKGRKVPPTPPPKTFRRPSSTGSDPRPDLPTTASQETPSRPYHLSPRIPRPKAPQPTSSQKSPLQKSASYGLGSSETKHDIKEIDEASIQRDTIGLLTKSPSNASSNGSVGNRSVSKSSSSASSVGLPISRKPNISKSSSMTSSRTDEEDAEEAGGPSSGASLENLTDDEPLYDTVAPDEEDPGEYVVLSDKSSEYNGTDTLKSGASGASSSEGGLRGSGGASSSTPSGSPAPDFILESPKHSNYVNIDYFLKR